jgi:hypothetical protein
MRKPVDVPGAPSDREQEYPATPIGAASAFDDAAGSSGKKTRTKPIRNAEGILIRKDGRPDMRSVSSANNLRKVHAKKEAERHEMEGRTPTSARSLAPATSNSGSEVEEGTRSGTPGSPGPVDGDEDEHVLGIQSKRERNAELMRQIFPDGADGSGGRELAANYFPRREETSSATDVVMKTEEGNGADHHEEPHGDQNGQEKDVDIRETSEATGEEQSEQVARVPTEPAEGEEAAPE